MLLLLVKGVLAVPEGWVELARDVALEASDDVSFRQAFAASSRHVVACWLVGREPDDDHAPECVVGVAVAAPVQTVAVCQPGGCRDGRHAAQGGEGAFAAKAFGVVDHARVKFLGPAR